MFPSPYACTTAIVPPLSCKFSYFQGFHLAPKSLFIILWIHGWWSILFFTVMVDAHPAFPLRYLNLVQILIFHLSGKVSVVFFEGKRWQWCICIIKKSLLLSRTKCSIKWFHLHSILKEEMGQIHFLNIIQCLLVQFLAIGAPWEFSAFPSGYFYHLNSSRLFGSFIKQHLAMLHGYWISLIRHHKSITPIP